MGGNLISERLDSVIGRDGSTYVRGQSAYVVVGGVQYPVTVKDMRRSPEDRSKTFVSVVEPKNSLTYMLAGDLYSVPFPADMDGRPIVPGDTVYVDRREPPMQVVDSKDPVNIVLSRHAGAGVSYELKFPASRLTHMRPDDYADVVEDLRRLGKELGGTAKTSIDAIANRINAITRRKHGISKDQEGGR